ncbi:hypothetical protein TWF225_000878 [Orbilia oligospora]|nr:hypothetical protein TWF225_000878 [Orbilia oligospora]KAF3292180.1 hypothetical protein TWF132_005852 [Orbilia oligospora]
MVVVEREWKDELNASMHVISGWLSAGRLSLLLFAGDEGHSSESGGFAQRDIARGLRISGSDGVDDTRQYGSSSSPKSNAFTILSYVIIATVYTVQV